jgi:hypothetical protein
MALFYAIAENDALLAIATAKKEKKEARKKKKKKKERRKNAELRRTVSVVCCVMCVLYDCTPTCFLMQCSCCTRFVYLLTKHVHKARLDTGGKVLKAEGL